MEALNPSRGVVVRPRVPDGRQGRATEKSIPDPLAPLFFIRNVVVLPAAAMRGMDARGVRPDGRPFAAGATDPAACGGIA